MAEPHDPKLLDRLKADLRLGDDTASILILRKLHDMAARMGKAPPRNPHTAGRLVVRGILAVEPRVYEERRRRRATGSELLVDALTKAFAFVTAVNLFFFALILALLFVGFWKPPQEPDSLALGLSDGFVGVSTAPADAVDDEQVEAEKGPDEEEQPEEEKTVDEPTADEVKENEAEAETEQPEQPGEEKTTESETLAEVPSFSEAEYDEILSNLMPEIGTGASGVPSPVAPKELGRLIRDDPTEATMKARAEELGQLARGRRGDIIVVTGEWDMVQRILTRFGVPHRTISPAALGSADLTRALVVIVNCDTSYKHDGSSGSGAIYRQLRELQQEADRLRREIDGLASGTTLHSKKSKDLVDVEKDIETLTSAIDEQHGPSAAAVNLRRFVGRGGYLMTSDWGVTLLEEAFPGYIAWADQIEKGSTTLTIPPEARGHALLRESLLGDSADTRVTPHSIRWEIDSSSYAFTVDEAQVDVLARGASLGGHKTIAATFRPAVGTTGTTTGRVLHMLSHIKIQRDKFGEYALQNVLLNFLLERVGSKE